MKLVDHDSTERNSPYRTAHRIIDNHAAIFTIRNPRATPGQFHIAHLLRISDTARKVEYTLVFYWVPAHQGTEGNEVEKAAREATGWRAVKIRKGRMVGINTDKTTDTWVNRTGKRLASCIRIRIEMGSIRQWSTGWEQGRTRGTLRKPQPTPSKNKLGIHSGVKRSIGSLVTQIRTEKMSLGAFLYSCKVPGYLTTQSGCERDQQTASHVLAKLRRYSEERCDFWQQKKRDMKNKKGELTP